MHHVSLPLEHHGWQQSLRRPVSSTNQIEHDFATLTCLAGHGWRAAGHLVRARRGPRSLPRPCCAGCSHSPASGARQVVAMPSKPALPPHQKHGSLLTYLAVGSLVWAAACSHSPGQSGRSTVAAHVLPACLLSSGMPHADAVQVPTGSPQAISIAPQHQPSCMCTLPQPCCFWQCQFDGSGWHRLRASC